jgi:hypothetical protein
VSAGRRIAPRRRRAWRSRGRAPAILTLLALAPLGASGAPPADGVPALRLAAEVERLASVPGVWPGFRPLAIPLAIYDGTRTYLFRHPTTLADFALLEDATPRGYVFDGRHPAVTANSSAEIGGYMTATLLFDPGSGEAPWTAAAEVAIHEAFHVFERQRHPAWQANEGDLLLYPFEDAEALALRRQETEALRRALAPRTRSHPSCWARHALLLRERRFARLDSAFVAYEREAERYEGLADYVAYRASRRPPAALPESGYAATRLRDRAYGTGLAWALLLDRFEPDWRDPFERAGTRYLDVELASVLGAGDDVAAGRCYFSEREAAEIERRARADAAAVVSERKRRREAFTAHPGFRVVVLPPAGEPLWPERFDPLQLERVEGGLLHTRWLRLGNESARIEMLADAHTRPEALTEPAGEHPLFQGVRRLEVVVSGEPVLAPDGESLTLRAPGLEARFERARLRQEESRLEISWASPP